MTSLCPHCGYDLDRDRLIKLDGFWIDPRGHIWFRGEDVPVKGAGKTILATLAKAYPRFVSHDVLIDRLEIDADCERDALKVHISQTRTALRSAGITQPIQTVWGLGYRWASPVGDRS